MATFIMLLITALIFWGLGWKDAERYGKRDDLELSNYYKDRMLEMQSEIVTLKAQIKN